MLPLAAIAVLFALPAYGPSSASAASSCTPALPHDAGDFPGTVISGGTERTYLLHVPPGYDGTDKTPLVLSFHGLGGDPQQQMAYSGLAATGDREGFVIVAPQGRGAERLSLTHWNVVFSTLPDESDDVMFTSDIIDAVSEELCIDQNRVFATGLSNGAQMVSRLACSLADRIAAAAPVSGLYFPPLAEELQDTEGCTPTRAVPIISFHGTDDPIIGFNGGRPVLAGFAIPLSFRDLDDEILPDWARAQGCGIEPEITAVANHVDLWSYVGCDDGSVIQMYALEGGGHTWPNAATEPVPETLGTTIREIDANELMWEFFQDHPLDGGSSSGSGFEAWWAFAIAGGVVGLAIVGSGAVYIRRR